MYTHALPLLGQRLLWCHKDQGGGDSKKKYRGIHHKKLGKVNKMNSPPPPNPLRPYRVNFEYLWSALLESEYVTNILNISL